MFQESWGTPFEKEKRVNDMIGVPMCIVFTVPKSNEWRLLGSSSKADNALVMLMLDQLVPIPGGPGGLRSVTRSDTFACYGTAVVSYL